MHIHEAERKLGLADKIIASQMIKAMATVRPMTDVVNIAEAQRALANCSLASNKAYNDLFFCSTVICSAGTKINDNTNRPYGLNLNDDVFLVDEVWNAKETIADKPVNIEHFPDYICGHLTSSWVLTANKKDIIAKNTAAKNLPDALHLACACVVYRKLDSSYASSIKDIILGIESGDDSVFVSLEAHFEEFDYFLFEPDSKEYKIIERNDETSWMSSLLRRYFGEGKYKTRDGKEYMIGRALRDITFTGKGFVSHPANEESVVLDSDFQHKVQKSTAVRYGNTAVPYQAAAKYEWSAGGVRIGNYTGAKVMASDGNITNEQYANVLARAKEADKLEKENEKLAARIEKLTEEKTAAKEQIGDLERQKKDIEFLKEKEIEAKKALQTSVADLQKQLDESHLALKKSEEAQAAINDEITNLKTELVSSKREAEMVRQGISQEMAKEFVAKWTSANDEQFASVSGPFIEIEKLKAAKTELENSGKKTAASAIDGIKPCDQNAEQNTGQQKSNCTIASLMSIPKVKR